MTSCHGRQARCLGWASNGKAPRYDTRGFGTGEGKGCWGERETFHNPLAPTMREKPGGSQQKGSDWSFFQQEVMAGLPLRVAPTCPDAFACARTSTQQDFRPMKLEAIKPRCSATTTKGRRCLMTAEPGESLCRYHGTNPPPRTPSPARPRVRAWFKDSTDDQKDRRAGALRRDQPSRRTLRHGRGTGRDSVPIPCRRRTNSGGS